MHLGWIKRHPGLLARRVRKRAVLPAAPWPAPLE